MTAHVSAPFLMSKEVGVHMNQLVMSSMSNALGAVLSFLLITRAQHFPPVVTHEIQTAQRQVKTIGMKEYRKAAESPGEALIVDVREL
jgi:hypothetical protein